ncbi:MULTISPECIES: SPOR domain-containing protein [unclassified Eikenella]|uniref:SPOR domain-containing protein n=1 Tax=unclassified Eikenella TaxID=2639367 RepID=UPI0008A4D568|nr:MULTISPECIES: SPOR domain-containing protein [unclassified Eikenella]OFK88165.1 hypothetical protein HMPREF2796_05570 [Eikenella sp. HMSC071B05]OFO48626.1 hypothetical protein HMPREF3043_00490 [Eikenella sp. HMSC073A11]
MPPQSNPNWRHLEEYEQIKRKNRRRLVGALLLTTVVALLLAKVMGSSQNTAAPGEITVSGGSETAASMVVETQPLPEPVAEVPTGADTAVEMQPQPVSAPVVEPEEVVVEPAPPAPQPVQPAKPVEARTTVLPNPLANSGNAANPPPSRPAAPPVRAESKPVPQLRVEAKPVPAEPRTQPAENNKPAAQPQAKPAVPETPRRAEGVKPQTPAVQPNERRAESKPAEPKPTEQKPAERRRPAERPAERRQERKPNSNRLSPEDILNNRAANHVAGNGKATDNQPAQAERRMVIQVGAYTTEEQARAVQKRLADAGVSAYVAPPANKGGNALYRVRTGSYPNRQAAGQAMGKIKSQGLDGILLER